MERRKHKEEQNLLDFFPVRAIEWEKKDDGTVCIKKPKTKNRFLKYIIKRSGKNVDYRIQLDDFGSHVWEKCDGHHRIEEIGISLQQKFGKKVEPVYERVCAFVRILAHNKFIVYKGT